MFLDIFDLKLTHLTVCSMEACEGYKFIEKFDKVNS